MKTFINENNINGFKFSAVCIIDELNLNVSKSAVCRILKCLNFDSKILRSQLTLLKKYQLKRILAVRSYIQDYIDWTKVIFTDEKRFILNLCDSYLTWILKKIFHRLWRGRF